VGSRDQCICIPHCLDLYLVRSSALGTPFTMFQVPPTLAADVRTKCAVSAWTNHWLSACRRPNC
jgi:hypothetical protein